MFKQFEFILRDELGEPHLDHEGKEIVVIGPSPNDIIGKVFLTKPDESGDESLLLPLSLLLLLLLLLLLILDNPT